MDQSQVALEELRREAHRPADPAPQSIPQSPPPDIGYESGGAARDLAGEPPARTPTQEDDFAQFISASYHQLRRGMAFLALAYPLVLMLVGGLDNIQTSISAYYHQDGFETRDIFVGGLFAVGAFLFFYKGYHARENIALNIAGIAAIVVALVPCDWPKGAPATIYGHIHGAAAVVFFLCIAFVCIFEHHRTLTLIADVAKQQIYRNLYRLLGVLMVAMPLGVFLLSLIAPAMADSPVTLIVEIVGVYVFAAFWLTKSREIALIESQ